MTENEKRMHRACFTGHRPEKLTRDEKSIMKDLEKEIRKAVADGMNVFIVNLLSVGGNPAGSAAGRSRYKNNVPRYPGYVML